MKLKSIIAICSLAVLIFSYTIYYQNKASLLSNNYKIGVIIFETGDAASYGSNCLNGMNLALEEINKNQNKVQLIIEDDQTNPEKAVSAYNKLRTTNPNIPVVIAALTSSSTLAIAPMANKDKIVLFSPCASSPEITNSGDYIFRNWPSDEVEGTLMAKFALNSKIDRISIFTMNNAYGNGLTKIFKNYYQKFGGIIESEDLFNENETQFKSMVNKIKNKNIKGIYAPSHAKEAGLLIKTLRENGIDIPILGCVTYESPDIFSTGGYNIKNVYLTTPWFDEHNNYGPTKNFAKNYRDKYGKAPDNFAAQSYDALMLVYNAVLFGGYNAEKIKEYLYKTKNYNGVSGLTTFDKNGDVNKPALIKKITNKKFVIVHEIK